jgi:hypothetical protein
LARPPDRPRPSPDGYKRAACHIPHGRKRPIGTGRTRPPRQLATIDHRERLWDRRSEIAADPFQILYQKNHALCGNCLNLKFSLTQPLGQAVAGGRNTAWYGRLRKIAARCDFFALARGSKIVVNVQLIPRGHR